MRIQNFKAPQETVPAQVPPGQAPSGPALAGQPSAESLAGAAATPHGPQGEGHERQSLEIALLKARIQHLELVVETARSLMGSNQERLLRQLHDVPREMVALGAQLRRIDPHAAW